ncbi:unnamed protein product [Lymnaea stagnalis]|uniref:Nucleotide exchange factor SIL1 n=1 Tax=Lymnaea stagnalis TaxID=6523 RepID=A0AAV2H3H7_LYMST
MSIICKSVKVAHILGVVLISSLCFYNLSVKSAAAEDGALTLVQDSNSNNNDEDDGVITIEDSDGQERDENIEIFEPTSEWKTVKKGQKIPPGLHVRMDLQTGEKQAKLMEVEGTQNKMEQWDAGENIGIINTEKKRYTRDELKAALKEFKYKDETPVSKEQKDEIKNNFRSYDELKKAMQDMNMAVKTEGEIVTELTAKLKGPYDDVESLKSLLVDIEYYLHQIDNAKLFADLGGLETMLKLMNNSNDDIRESVTHAIAAGLQSNAKVQVSALDIGVMQQLVRMLSVDPSQQVRKKALFALSTLVRQFPFAQKKFLQLGGLSALANMFIKSEEESLKIKIITLLTDLLLEYDFNQKQSTSSDPIQVERSIQYKDIQLRENMSTSGWCTLMASLLHSPSGHDSVEKVLHAMSALITTCKDEFTPTRPKLQALLTEYQHLAQEEVKDGHDDFYSSIYSTLRNLVNEIHRDDL